MHRSLCLVLLLAIVAVFVSGCVTDRTGRSASYLMTTKLESTRARARALEDDLLLERQRIDDMQSRAAASRKRLAESGATLESFLEELQAVRGQLALLRHELDGAGRQSEDTDLRLTELEVILAELSQQVGLEPVGADAGSEAPPGEDAGSSESAKTVSEDAAPAGEAEAVEAVEREAEEKPSTPVVADEAAETAADPVVADAPGDDEVQLGSAVEEIVMQTQGGEPAAVQAAPEASPESTLFQAGLLLVKARSWERAGGRLQQFLRTYPASKWAQEAMYLVGECLFELGRYKMAITEFQKVIERDGRSPWAPRAMLRQSYAFAALGTAEDQEASQIFLAELIRLYPEAKEAEEARTTLEQDNAE